MECMLTSFRLHSRLNMPSFASVEGPAASTDAHCRSPTVRAVHESQGIPKHTSTGTACLAISLILDFQQLASDAALPMTA